MFEIFELLGLCGILGAKSLSNKSKMRKANREWAKHNYNIELQKEIRYNLAYKERKPDGTKLRWSACNPISYDYITVQELKKRGYEPTPWFTRYDFSKYEFDEDGGLINYNNYLY